MTQIKLTIAVFAIVAALSIATIAPALMMNTAKAFPFSSTGNPHREHGPGSSGNPHHPPTDTGNPHFCPNKNKCDRVIK
jgi:hypothetical protein